MITVIIGKCHQAVSYTHLDVYKRQGKVSVILCNNATESVEIDLQQALPEGYNYTLKGSLNVGDQQEKLENNKLELPAYGIVILKQSGVCLLYTSRCV